jgi:hypothetical protein
MQNEMLGEDRLARFKAEFVADLPVHAISLLLLTGCLVLFAFYGLGVGPDLIALNAKLYANAAFALIVIDLAWLLVRNKPDRPTRFLIDTYRARVNDPVFVARLPLLGIAIVFMPFFSKMKSMIPLFNTFDWDSTFIAWDRAIFFGYDAWQVLQPVFGYPIVSAAMAGLYHVWMLLIYIGTLFFIFYPAANQMRRHYLLGFVLIWTLIGGVMATALASVGPVFMNPIMGDPTFDAQMAYLNAANEQVPILTLHVQEMLLGWYHAGDRGLGSGITAMPSMHVSMAFLFWLAIRRVSANAGRFFFAFMALIWIGSVHLAYHYAVDGLVSVIATAFVWGFVNAIIRGWDVWREKVANSGELAAA